MDRGTWMDISVYIGEVAEHTTLDDTIGAASWAANAGLSRVWTAQALNWDSLTQLALIGTAVPDIGLGSGVIPIPQHHPLLLAGQALTVQAAVGGRLTLGIGAGVGSMVEARFGLPRDRPAARMREYLAVLQPLLRGEAVDHHGETLTAVGSVKIPDAQPPRVLIAALGPAMLKIAGEQAEGTVTWMTGPRTLAGHIVPTLTRAAEAAGRPRPQVVAGIFACLTNDEDAARERIGADFRLAGRVPEYRAVLDREGVAGAQDVAAVGDEAAVARQLTALADAGVTEAAVAAIGTPAEKTRTLAFLADLAPGRGRAALSAQDRLAIHELIALHGHLADDRNDGGLSRLLTPEAVYDIRSYGLGNVVGLPAIQVLFRDRPGNQPVGHHVSNVLVDQRPDGTVAVRSKGLAVMADGTASTCTYDDVVVRTGDGWRIARRQVRPARTD
ncbi:MAG TPA: TIGR03564 family F420-dependent LLM class oxidoreductase [Pseudonocardia sp.]